MLAAHRRRYFGCSRCVKDRLLYYIHGSDVNVTVIRDPR